VVWWEVGRFESEELLSLLFGVCFVACVLQVITHLLSYLVPSLKIPVFLEGNLVTGVRIKQ
jgi:hypothetical protein